MTIVEFLDRKLAELAEARRNSKSAIEIVNLGAEIGWIANASRILSSCRPMELPGGDFSDHEEVIEVGPVDVLKPAVVQKGGKGGKRRKDHGAGNPD